MTAGRPHPEGVPASLADRLTFYALTAACLALWVVLIVLAVRAVT